MIEEGETLRVRRRTARIPDEVAKKANLGRAAVVEHLEPAQKDARHWKVRARRPVADYLPWLRLWEEDLELPDGRVIERFTQVELPDFVVVAAVTPTREMVIERSYKHAAGSTAISLPAGYIEQGEDPLIAAQRELREETGYAAVAWKALGAFVVDGNRGCGTGHFYLARNAYLAIQQRSGDLEEIEVEVMGFDDLWRAARSGEVRLLAAVAAIGLAAAALRE